VAVVARSATNAITDGLLINGTPRLPPPLLLLLLLRTSD